MGRRIAGVLFDIGGVLVALDGVPSLARLLGLEEDHDALHSMWMKSPSVVAHETGKIEAEEFAAGVVADLSLPVSAAAFFQDFCNWPKSVLPGAMQLLNEIPRRYCIAALSNTSAVHWDSVVAMGVVEQFDHVYLSHEIGYVKPAPEAFLLAVKGMGLLPSEVLFLDDVQRNIDAARELGIRAHVARGPEEARSVLVKYGVI